MKIEEVAKLFGNGNGKKEDEERKKEKTACGGSGWGDMDTWDVIIGCCGWPLLDCVLTVGSMIDRYLDVGFVFVTDNKSQGTSLGFSHYTFRLIIGCYSYCLNLQDCTYYVSMCCIFSLITVLASNF